MNGVLYLFIWKSFGAYCMSETYKRKIENTAQAMRIVLQDHITDSLITDFRSLYQ